MILETVFEPRLVFMAEDDFHALWPEGLGKTWSTLCESEPGEGRWLTTEEAAAIAGFKPVTIRRACCRGEIPGAEKVRGEWRIPEGATGEWVRSRGQIEKRIRVSPSLSRATAGNRRRGTQFRDRITGDKA